MNRVYAGLENKEFLVVATQESRANRLNEMLVSAGCKVINVADKEAIFRQIDVLEKIDGILFDAGSNISNCYELLRETNNKVQEAKPVFIICDQEEPEFDNAFYEGAEAIFVEPIISADFLSGIEIFYLEKVDPLLRKHLRRKARGVWVSYSINSSSELGYVANISVGGAFIGSMGNLPSVGQMISFVVEWTETELEIAGEAEVKWLRTKITRGQPRGFGVQFSPESQEAFQKVWSE